jgi:hypothetical protein
MSDPLPYPGLTQSIRLPSRVLEAFLEYVRPNPISQQLSLRTRHIRSPGQVLEKLVGHILPLIQTCRGL